MIMKLTIVAWVIVLLLWLFASIRYELYDVHTRYMIGIEKPPHGWDLLMCTLTYAEVVAIIMTVVLAIYGAIS